MVISTTGSSRRRRTSATSQPTSSPTATPPAAVTTNRSPASQRTKLPLTAAATDLVLMPDELAALDTIFD